MKAKEVLRLVSALIICQLAGVVGSVFTISAIPVWYAALEKPGFSPPNWVFSPAWVTLFALMGIALFLVWRKGLKTKGVKPALTAFGAQLALNASWSIIFFGLKSPLYAFIEIIALWAAILATIYAFRRVSKTAAYLLVPYILWVSFAAVLNFYIVVLN